MAVATVLSRSVVRNTEILAERLQQDLGQVPL